MTDNTPPARPDVAFAPRGSTADVEQGLLFQPHFDADGLIPAIVTDATTGQVLMFAWMDREALARTLATGHGHFYSRSRRRQWKKGEDSGNVLEITEIRTDCDQDVIWLRARVAGAGVACHTGAVSCFYRLVKRDPASPTVHLQRVDHG